MKKCLALLLAALMLTGTAHAMEITDDDLTYWSDRLCWLVYNTPDGRNAGTEGEAIACNYLRNFLTDMGFSTILEVPCAIPSGAQTQPSLIAVLPAQNANPQIITLSAHYDSHVPGARDNASGVAALLTLAMRFLQNGPYENTELRFAFFTAEETGHQGSLAYCESLTEDEVQRSLAAFNIDLITLDMFEEDRAFSVDTMGMRTEIGYQMGSQEMPAYNRAALAMLRAMQELDVFPADEEGDTWCAPRHKDMSDHESFHIYGIDSVNVCFRGNVAEGGSWPEVMHTDYDTIGDIDYERTGNALSAIYTATAGLASNHLYGLEGE